jgi:hypothetical protein
MKHIVEISKGLLLGIVAIALLPVMVVRSFMDN